MGAAIVLRITSGVLCVITLLMIIGMVGFTPFLQSVISGEAIRF